MVHTVDRCDFIDELEEATKTGGTVTVEMSGGQSFTDTVRAVENSGGEDFATFGAHGRVALSDIRDCRRAQPLETDPAVSPR